MTELTDRLRDDERAEWAICKEAADTIERLTAENQAMREWIEREGMEFDICTRNILGNVCKYCRCKHQKDKP